MDHEAKSSLTKDQLGNYWIPNIMKSPHHRIYKTSLWTGWGIRPTIIHTINFLELVFLITKLIALEISAFIIRDHVTILSVTCCILHEMIKDKIVLYFPYIRRALVYSEHKNEYCIANTVQ